VLTEQMELQGRKAQQVQLALRVLMVLTVQLAHKGHKVQLALRVLTVQMELQAHKGRQVLRELQELQELQAQLALRDQTLL